MNKEDATICLLNDSFPPMIDGVANTVVNYADIIEKNHGHSFVVTPKVRGVDDDSKYAFPIVRYPSLDTRKFIGYVAGNPFSPESIRNIQKEDAAVYHTHSPVTSALMARQLAEITHKPLIMTWHTKYDMDIANAVNNKLLQEGAVQFLVRNANACDEVWAVSEGAGENLKSLGYEGDYIVMPNGVDLPHERPSQTAIDEVTSGYDLPEDVPCYLFIGRMMWYKGVRLMLDALAELDAEGVDFRMVFIGDSNEREEIQKYSEELGLSEKAYFTGAIRDRDALRAWYARADLFLFPSTYDTNGLVVREAAANDTASVIIKGSCAAEGVLDGRNGFLIEENKEALAAKLRELAQKPEFVKEVGKAAGDEIYISWDDAVAHAYERYMIVIDKFKSGEYPKPGALKELRGRSLDDFVQLCTYLNDTGKAIRSDAINIVSEGKQSLKNRTM